MNKSVKKSVKKLMLICFMLFASLICKDTYALDEGWTEINYEKLFSIEKPAGYTAFQGFTVTKDYIIASAINNNDESKNTAVFVYDKKTYKLADIKQNPITDYNFGHSNDMSYNPNTNELLVLSNNKVQTYDASNFQFKEEKKLASWYSGIGYDKTTNKYVLYGGPYGPNNDTTMRTMHIYNSNFEEENSFYIKPTLTTQGLEAHDGLIYFTCYESGKANIYQTIYREEYAGTNLIYVYDYSGNLKNTYFINNTYGEIETIDFIEDKMLVGFNPTNYKTFDFYESKINPVNASLNINVSYNGMIFKDNDFQFELYKDGTLLTKKGNIGDVVTFDNLNITDVGEYNYVIKQTDMNDKDTTYYTDDINVKVIVKYNPATDKLEYKTTYNNLDTIIVTNSNEKGLYVPDTGKGQSIYVISGIIIFIVGTFLINKHKESK